MLSEVDKTENRSRSRPRRSPEKGQAIIEMAFVLPLLVLLIFAITDFSMLFFIYQSLGHGINEASRYGATGQQREDPGKSGSYLSREASIKLIMRETNPLVTLNDSAFVFEHLDGTTWKSGLGNSGEISRITVSCRWKPITPLIAVFFPDGEAKLQVSATRKDEGF